MKTTTNHSVSSWMAAYGYEEPRDYERARSSLSGRQIRKLSRFSQAFIAVNRTGVAVVLLLN